MSTPGRDYKGQKMTTTSGEPVEQVVTRQQGERGLRGSYVILAPEERAKGFVRPVRLSYIHVRCSTRTNMAKAIAETFARDPQFYTHTFCVRCDTHVPVGECIWEADASPVGS